MNKRVMRWIAVSSLCAGMGGATGALAQETNDGREISIVIEEGDRVPAQVLDALAAQELGSAVAGSANVTFAVTEGGASLVSAGQTVGAGGSAVAHPEVVPGRLYDETYVRIFADGQPVGKLIRVGTIASGSLDQLLAKDVPAGSEALLARGADYAAVDTGLLRSETAPDTTEPATGQYCTAIVSKERDIYGTSRVLAEGCSDQSDAEAIAQAKSKAAASGENVINSTRLFTLYFDYGYSGQYYYTYEGCCGDCDPQGYIIETSRIPWPSKNFWNHHISSIGKPHLGTCDYARYRKIKWWGTYENWGSWRNLPDWYVGDYYNDVIATMWSPHHLPECTALV